MQGAYVNGSRPKTKKALKEAVAANLQSVELEATSVFGNEFGGSLANAPDGKYYVVGPDPYRKRSWYAQIVKQGGSVKVN